MKYPRASGTLRQAPDPTLKRACFTHTTLLRTVSNLGLSRSGPPPDQILDPPLYNHDFVDNIEGDGRFPAACLM